jgi:hypothetical protein
MFLLILLLFSVLVLQVDTLEENALIPIMDDEPELIYLNTLDISRDDDYYFRGNRALQFLEDWTEENPDEDWWMFGTFTYESWYIAVHPPHDESFSPLLTIYPQGYGNSRNRYCNDLLPIQQLDAYPVEFPYGEAWATLRFCSRSWEQFGDGPDCGGYGLTYVPAVWYTFQGMLDDETMITADVPLDVPDLPMQEMIINTCTDPVTLEQITTPDNETLADAGWEIYTNGYLRLTPEGEAAYLEVLSTILTERLEDDLAETFAALNEVFATLALE